jgi:membrane associated rhomboid family serine protease
MSNRAGDDAPGETDPRDLTTLIRSVTSRPQFSRNIVLLFGVPILVLTAIHLTTTPALFEYDIDNPTIWGIYTSNLSHRSWAHLGSNLAGLVIIGGAEYALLTASGCRRHYVGVFLGSLLVFPLFTHLFLQYVMVHQPVFQSYEAVGFSEPIAALAGYFPLALATYHRQASGFPYPILYTVLLSAGGIGVSLIGLSGVSVSLLMLLGLSAAGITALAWHLSTTVHTTGPTRVTYELTTLFFHVIYLFALVALFGGDTGTVVGHLAGYLPGFALPLLCAVTLIPISNDEFEPPFL